MFLFSGFNKVSTVPLGSISNAAFVGAKTVKGPAPCKVSTKPAAFTAATSVVCSFELAAFWLPGFSDGFLIVLVETPAILLHQKTSFNHLIYFVPEMSNKTLLHHIGLHYQLFCVGQLTFFAV